MKLTQYWSFAAVLFISYVLYIANASDCKAGEYDISPLDRTWIAHSDDDDHNITYQISLCSPLSNSPCPSNTAICMTFPNGTSLSTASFTNNITSPENEESGDMWLFMNGATCPEAPHTNLTVSINLKCGPTMGSPKLLDYMYCVSYFEWESHVYCKGDKPEEEVPCYLYDEQGNRYDLSPLSKTTGGYLVMSEMDTDVYINVCRDVDMGTTGTSCPSGNGGYKKVGSDCIGLGKPTDGLQQTSRGLSLKYTSDSSYKPSGCTTPPTTEIIFMCPKRGGSKNPLVIQDEDCQYIIEWQTEYACPEAKLSNNTCVLTKEAADIDIDLRPLTNPKGTDNPYRVAFTDSSGVKYDFFLNVCEDLGIPCPNTEVKTPACQTKQDSDFAVSMGSLEHKTLRYADGDLMLIYKGGAMCHHNQFKRQTIITFVCNQTAGNDGRGQPIFENENDCTYRFTWPTKYACLDHPVDEECRVNFGAQSYDLSPLVKTHGGNWVALGNHGDEVGEYYINICHNILQTAEAARCDPGAAACFRGPTGSINLGRYMQSPTFDNKTKSLQIKYTQGDTCVGTRRRSSTITFICKPGASDTGPVLTYKSFDDCQYEFEWQTSAACVLGHYVGTSCKVYDEDAGFNFDLSPLMKTAPPYYTVDPGATDNQEYVLNVCGPVTGTPCNSLTEESFDVSKAGICQQPKKDQSGSSFIAGQYTEDLRYYDGMINLTYSGGSKYQDDASTPRKTQITFLCDPDAGPGHPTFLSEVPSEHYYGFEWKTAYACPNQPVECVAEGTNGTQYDLSSLALNAEKGNWVVENIEGTARFYINVCNSLNKINVGNGCGALASVCRTNITAGQPEVVDIPNLGSVTMGPTVVSEGHLRLKYTGSKTCKNGSQTVPYMTNIDFTCLEGSVISTPSPPVKSGPCEYTITWTTAYACPIRKDIVEYEQCTVKDPHSGYVFNLQPLVHAEDKPYVVTVQNKDYKINICANLSSSICDKIDNSSSAVCSVNKEGAKESIAKGHNYKLEFNEAGRIALVYHGKRKSNGQPTQVQISFECAPDVPLGQPEFVGQDEDTYIFTFRTSLACMPMGTDCFVMDKDGNQYDLGTLSREDGWSVLDTRDPSTKYYINVCRPVNNIPQSHCPDGAIGGCQVASNGNSYNIGYVQGKPVARDDGTLSIQYRNGDVCHKGTPKQAHRSTRINFFCSQIEDGPVFETETDTCEYIFNWRTPAACKLQSASGQDCKLKEPRYGYEFDLNQLRSSTKDYHVTTPDGYDYMINVCGALVEAGHCNLTTGVGSCQTKPNSDFVPVNAGKGNSNLRYASGELSLTYDGGKDSCHGKYTRKTIITFVCDNLKSGSDGPIFIKETYNCQYLFEWHTSLACTPHQDTACTYRDDQGNSYDLTSLTLYNNNYDYMDTVNKIRYVINVCYSVIHKPNSTCPYNAAACMVNLTKPDTATDKYVDIGGAYRKLSMEDGKLTLTYTRGGTCAEGSTFSMEYSTKITFLCDSNAKDTSPTGHFMAGECEHHFLWTTDAACPISQSQPSPPDTGKPSSGVTCKVTEPVTGVEIDLSQLKSLDQPYTVTDNSGHLFEFDICGPVANSKCTNSSANIGVCQSETGVGLRTYNAGNAVNNLWFDDGVVVYNLTGGDKCHNGMYERSTIINFVCNGNKGIGRPVFLDETDDCTYFIAWHTSLVCENEVRCSIDTDDFHTLDLSPLSRNPDNIVQSSLDSAVYYLSVCQPLQPVPGTLCPAGAGSCQVKSGQKPMSLGKPKSPPTFDKATDNVILQYVNGSTCDLDPSKNFSSRITFACQPGPVRSNPVLLDKVGCEFVFQWPTAVVCYEREEQTPTDTCGFTDPWTNNFYNFTVLGGETPYEVIHMGTTYWINMCGSVTKKAACGSAMVCRDKDGLSFGEPKQFKAELDSRLIKVTYQSGGKCSGDTMATSQILFMCNRSAGFGKPEYLVGGDCQVEFFWKTSIVCPPIKTQCSFVDGSKLYDMSLLSRDVGAWNLTDNNGNKYWINICGAIDHTVAHGQCGKTTGACRLGPNGNYDNLGQVTAQQPLYKDAKTGAIVLEYHQGGTSACSRGKTRSDNDAAKTKINFICGDTYGGPKYVQSDEECVFEFNWKTKMACAVEKNEVHATDGKLVDPRSGGTIDLNHVLKTSFTVPPESGLGTAYEIRLDGNSTHCVKAAVCDIRDTKHYKVLGKFDTVKYFFDDDLLEAVYTSAEKCSGDLSTKHVTSVIHFHCSKKDSNPRLLYKSKDCMFVFDWETTVACLNAEVLIPAEPNSKPDDSSSGSSGTGTSDSGSSKGGVAPKTVGTIIAVFTTAIVLCILLVVFHKQERRAACMGGVRKLLRHKSSDYTSLPTDAADDLQGEEDILTFSDPLDTEANREEDPIISVTTAPQSYHDDSDEDLLA